MDLTAAIWPVASLSLFGIGFVIGRQERRRAHSAKFVRSLAALRRYESATAELLSAVMLRDRALMKEASQRADDRLRETIAVIEGE